MSEDRFDTIVTFLAVLIIVVAFAAARAHHLVHP